MKTKRNIKEIKILLKRLKTFKPCKELNLNCPNCKFMILRANLEWWLDLEEWGEKN